jgi:hypothetical protein
MTKYHFDIIKQISEHIDNGIVNENQKRPIRKYIGGSSLGNECVRQTQYSYMQTKKDSDFDARTLRIFEFGHHIEDMVATYLKNAGFDLRTHDKQGEQFGFSVADDQIKGHIDGVICGGPVAMDYPFLWECKSANSKKFGEFVRKGVAQANPTYAAQIALYQTYMELVDFPALFTVMNKDTSELYFEFVPFNAELAQKISDRGVEIIKATRANEMLPRIANESDYFTCKYCDYRNTCWA